MASGPGWSARTEYWELPGSPPRILSVVNGTASYQGPIENADPWVGEVRADFSCQENPLHTQRDKEKQERNTGAVLRIWSETPRRCYTIHFHFPCLMQYFKTFPLHSSELVINSFRHVADNRNIKSLFLFLWLIFSKNIQNVSDCITLGFLVTDSWASVEGGITALLRPEAFQRLSGPWASFSAICFASLFYFQGPVLSF